MYFFNIGRVILTMGPIGFFSILITSVLLATTILSRIASIALGIVYVLLVVIELYAYKSTPDFDGRVTYIIVSIISGIAALSCFIINDDWHFSAPYLTKAVVYFFISSAGTAGITQFTVFFTSTYLADTMKSALITFTQQMELSTLSTFISTLTLSLVIPVADEKKKINLFVTTIIFSVGLCLINAIVQIAVGVMMVNKSTANLRQHQIAVAKSSTDEVSEFSTH